MGLKKGRRMRLPLQGTDVGMHSPTGRVMPWERVWACIVDEPRHAVGAALRGRPLHRP